MQMWKYANVEICKCGNMQIWKLRVKFLKRLCDMDVSGFQSFRVSGFQGYRPYVI